MISRRLVVGLAGAGAIAVALYAVPPAPARSPESRNARLDQILHVLVEGHSTPGIVVLILQNGQPVYSRSVGIREVGGDASIDESGMFRIASMTKAVTSVAAMILVEEGKIDLNDPVSRFLPEFGKLRVRGPDGTEAPARIPDDPRIDDSYRWVFL